MSLRLHLEYHTRPRSECLSVSLCLALTAVSVVQFVLSSSSSCCFLSRRELLRSRRMCVCVPVFIAVIFRLAQNVCT